MPTVRPGPKRDAGTPGHRRSETREGKTARASLDDRTTGATGLDFSGDDEIIGGEAGGIDRARNVAKSTGSRDRRGEAHAVIHRSDGIANGQHTGCCDGRACRRGSSQLVHGNGRARNGGNARSHRNIRTGDQLADHQTGVAVHGEGGAASSGVSSDRGAAIAVEGGGDRRCGDATRVVEGDRAVDGVVAHVVQRTATVHHNVGAVVNFGHQRRRHGRVVDDQRAIRDGRDRDTTIGAGRAQGQRALIDDGIARSSTVGVIAGQGQRAAARLHHAEACGTGDHTGNRGRVVRIDKQFAST